mgnify:CR=1 FL=1|tara:strand:- start:109 stop:279 length:171 start_codon:yes stop_codon:yes gene_type:complete
MFYKKDNEQWFVGKRVSFPDLVTISINNKVDKDGWKWYDTPPTEYTEWLEINNEEI